MDNYISAICREYREQYSRIYDSRDNVPGYMEAMNAGDKFLSDKRNAALIGAMCNFMKDFFSSDREAAALGFTIKIFGLI